MKIADQKKNIKMPRFLYLILFALLANFNVCLAAKSIKIPKHPLVVKNDSSAVQLRNFNKATLDAYSKQPEFKYDEEVATPSLWTRFWRWFWHLFHLPKAIASPSAGFFYILFRCLEYLIIAAGIGALVYFILKMAGIDMANIFRQKALSASQPYTESLEDIHDISFDTAIEQALNHHDYRLAVRLLYLKSLKQLDDASLIKWQPEKTNSTYINELADNEQRTIFKSLTRRFEYVWYGEFPIDGLVFNRINLLFQEFKNKIA